MRRTCLPPLPTIHSQSIELTCIAFAFGARWIDTPIAFILGIILALLQLVVAKHSMLYSNVFEISAAIVTSFLARGFGSIPPRGLFCFSSLTASSIALILPGYIVCTCFIRRKLTGSDGIFGVAVEEYCCGECEDVVCCYRKSQYGDLTNCSIHVR